MIKKGVPNNLKNGFAEKLRTRIAIIILEIEIREGMYWDERENRK